jgi:hypothetical protein
MVAFSIGTTVTVIKRGRFSSYTVGTVGTIVNRRISLGSYYYTVQLCNSNSWDNLHKHNELQEVVNIKPEEVVQW